MGDEDIMKKFGLTILAMVLALALSACSDSDDNAGGSTTASLAVIGTSGSTVDMNATWTRPCSGSGPAGYSTHTLSGGTMTIVAIDYYSDSTCTTADTTINATVTYRLDSVVDPVSWIDGSDTASTDPTATGATTGNGLTETITAATITPNTTAGVTALMVDPECDYMDWTVGVAYDAYTCFGGGDSFKVTWVVDDDATVRYFYENRNPTPADADGYPTEIADFDPLEN